MDPAAELAGLRNYIEQLERDNKRLQESLVTARTRPIATTGIGLVHHVEQLLPTDFRGLDIVADEDEDGDLTLTFIGLTLDAFGSIERRTIEFEVEATITIPVTLTVRTTSEDEAHDIATDYLSEVRDNLDDPYVVKPDSVEDFDFGKYGAEADIDRVREV